MVYFDCEFSNVSIFLSVTDPSTISEPIYRFLGNHTHSDYFKLLKKEANSLLIGARNMVYNLSLPTLEQKKIQKDLNDNLPH